MVHLQLNSCSPSQRIDVLSSANGGDKGRKKDTMVRPGSPLSRKPRDRQIDLNSLSRRREQHIAKQRSQRPSDKIGPSKRRRCSRRHHPCCTTQQNKRRNECIQHYPKRRKLREFNWPCRGSFIQRSAIHGGGM